MHIRYTKFDLVATYPPYQKAELTRPFSDLSDEFSHEPESDDNYTEPRTGEFIYSLQNVKYVSLLPYHNAGVDKYKNMGRTYNFKKLQSPSGQNLSMIRKKLEAFGLKVRIGGR